MNFSVSSSAFLKQLQLASGALSSNPVMSILEDFLLELKGKILTITTSNLEVSIQTSIEVEGKGNGKIAISGKTLLETLKSLPEQFVHFEINDETRGVEITSSSGKYKMVGENPADFPEMTKPDGDDNFTIESKNLLVAIDRTIFATSNDEMRQAMKGICMNINFNNVTFVATDAHKLVKSTFLDVVSETATSIILTKKTLLTLKGILRPESNVKVYFNKSKAYFEFDNVMLTTRLIEGKFPDYNAVIPINNPNKLRISRQDLLSSIRRLAIFANKSTNQIVFDLQENSLTINAQDLDMNNEATEQMICNYDGDPVDISLNAKYLIEILSVMTSEEIIFEINTTNKPVIILPAEQEPNEDLLMLVVSNY
ncbi:MAG: DNA polymerase III subunit beta [Saprospiraceae bacterium]|nr:DNA polymerase III subunit beta [Saprospiraceae bacterium]